MVMSNVFHLILQGRPRADILPTVRPGTNTFVQGRPRADILPTGQGRVISRQKGGGFERIWRGLLS